MMCPRSPRCSLAWEDVWPPASPAAPFRGPVVAVEADTVNLIYFWGARGAVRVHARSREDAAVSPTARPCVLPPSQAANQELCCLLTCQGGWASSYL